MNMNADLAYRVVQELIYCGVKEICSCPGSRNAPLCMTFEKVHGLKIYNWPEERSAAYFALGRSIKTGLPVPVVVTSGTAAAELLPAAVEGFYSGVPLILLTADRPRKYRLTGAPQAAEQVGLYSHYALFNIDVEGNESIDLSGWDQRSPCHINVCFEEPQGQPLTKIDPQFQQSRKYFRKNLMADIYAVDDFLADKQYPFVIVGTLKLKDRKNVKRFLLSLKCPVFLEANSGLREDPDLQHLSIRFPEKLFPRAKESGYPVDAILRIGGVPTLRFWRDLEIIKTIPVLSVNDVPFSGLTGGSILTTDLDRYFELCKYPDLVFAESASWIADEQQRFQELLALCETESKAETALIHALSKEIPPGANVFLGNSLPIREWDLAATTENRNFQIYSNRGCNGIDGQVSTALGLSDPTKENWMIIGDLTALYDLVGPWGLRHLKTLKMTIVIINNGGAKIFAKLFPEPELQNCHDLNFEGFAKQWDLHYQKCGEVGELKNSQSARLIEIVPDEASTARFNKQLTDLQANRMALV